MYSQHIKFTLLSFSNCHWQYQFHNNQKVIFFHKSFILFRLNQAFSLSFIYRILQPQFLGLFISYFSANNGNHNAISSYRAASFAAGTILCSLIPVIVFHPFFLYVLNIGQRIRIACCALLYKKVKIHALINYSRNFIVQGMTNLFFTTNR